MSLYNGYNGARKKLVREATKRPTATLNVQECMTKSGNYVNVTTVSQILHSCLHERVQEKIPQERPHVVTTSLPKRTLKILGPHGKLCYGQMRLKFNYLASKDKIICLRILEPWDFLQTTVVTNLETPLVKSLSQQLSALNTFISPCPTPSCV